MPDEAGVASESTTQNCRFGWGRVSLGSDPLAAPGGKAPQCLDNTSGTEAQPEGDLPRADSGRLLASPAAGSPPPAIDLPAVAVDAVDAGTAAAPEPENGAPPEPGPHGEEGAPEVAASSRGTRFSEKSKGSSKWISKPWWNWLPSAATRSPR